MTFHLYVPTYERGSFDALHGKYILYLSSTYYVPYAMCVALPAKIRINF